MVRIQGPEPFGEALVLSPRGACEFLNLLGRKDLTVVFPEYSILVSSNLRFEKLGENACQ